jgi:hypothetical protein
MKAPRRCYWEFEQFAVHVEWLTRAIGIYRIFEAPIGQIEAETGQPWKAWAWCCVVILRRTTLTVCGAATAPNRDWLRGCKQTARDLGMRTLEWERWHEGRKFSLEFAL